MTSEQLDNQMKQFLIMVEKSLHHMAWENHERLDISGFIEKFHDTVEALDLEDEVFIEKTPINLMKDTDPDNLI